MVMINLLPWRDRVREKRKKAFISISIVVVALATLILSLIYLFYSQKLNDQLQANQLIIERNQRLNQQLHSLDGLQEQRIQILKRMRLIQDLQSKRPIVVRFMDELVRLIPAQLFLDKFSQTGDQFTFEGYADNPNTVAEFLRNLEASPWYRNAFMNSFLAANSDHLSKSSFIPNVEASFGRFVVTAYLARPDLLNDQLYSASESSSVYQEQI